MKEAQAELEEEGGEDEEADDLVGGGVVLRLKGEGLSESVGGWDEMAYLVVEF